MGSHDPFGHLTMAKRKVGSQIGNLTPDHKKSGIDSTPVRTGGMR